MAEETYYCSVEIRENQNERVFVGFRHFKRNSPKNVLDTYYILFNGKEGTIMMVSL